MKVEWDAHKQADRMSSMSTLPLKAREANKVRSSIGKGRHLPFCCLVDMVDQLPDPSLECVLMDISFVAILVGYEEKLLVLALILYFGQVDYKSSYWTKRAVL